MTVISRHLALACRLPRSVYDALGARGGPVGASVCDAQRDSIEHLWRQVHLPAGHRDRQRKLADRCDATWFRDTFCGDDDALVRAGKECDIPNFKGSYLGRFPLVSADFWTSDHLSERSRSVGAVSGTRARGTLTLRRR